MDTVGKDTSILETNISFQHVVDGMISDDDLPDYLLDSYRKFVNSDNVNVVVDSVTRDGSGVITSLSIRITEKD